MHLNVVELVLFDDDLMYYCNFPFFNEQNSSLSIIIYHERLAFCLDNSQSRNHFTENRVTTERRRNFLASRKSSKTCLFIH